MPQVLEDGHGCAATAPHPELVARAGRRALVQADNASHYPLPLSGNSDSLAVADDDQAHDVADWREYVESRIRGQLVRPVRRAERGNGRVERPVPRLAPTLLQHVRADRPSGPS